jgi:hypothetical protein
MEYVMSCSDALTFHHDLPFIPLHYTYVTFTSSPQFTSLHFTSLHFTSLHFWWFLPHLHFALFIIFLTLFLKLLGLQERVPKASAGSWFQSWMVLFAKKYFLLSVFCFCSYRPWSDSMVLITVWVFTVYAIFIWITLYVLISKGHLQVSQTRGVKVALQVTHIFFFNCFELLKYIFTLFWC